MENLIEGLCQQLKKSHPLFVVTSFVDSARRDEGWVLRPRRPGLLPFSLHALYQGSLLLWNDRRIKVILGGSALVTPLVLVLAKVFRRRAAVYVHGLDLIYPSLIYQALCVRWIRYCDRVVANSRYTASMAEAKKARRDSIHVIPPGVRVELPVPLEAKEAKKGLGLAGRKVLLYVGRLARRKGVKEFLQRALPKIAEAVPGVCFVIVGENPSDSMVHRDDIMGELRRAAQDMRLDDQVRFLGWLEDEDLAKVYLASDILVLPVLPLRGDVEGFGIVILEAAAAGRPAVATRVGGIPDAIEDGKSGILVDPERYDLMSQTIVRLLRDDQARVALGEYAQKRVREKFGWDAINSRYEELFKLLAELK